MTAADVMRVLELLNRQGLRAWLDGGWGVDVLVGRVTRQHADLDLVMLLDEVAQIERAVDEIGFGTLLRDWLPTALAVSDGQGREIDLHPVVPTKDGGGDQAQLNGGSFHYPPPVEGVLAGRRVLCVDATTQVRCHLGYEPSAKDRQDIAQLHRSHGVELPATYRTEAI